jgi:ectoine hydroxylase-related dioxygenase (phytanoyl-CoA dioxygenase family)
MPLTEEQIEHYYREGYVLVPALVGRAQVEATLTAIPADAQDNGRWQAQVFDHTNPDLNAPIHRLLVEPEVYGAAAQIFGQPARVYYGMLAIVPARGGHGLPWHQDNQYTHLWGGALNVFIALSEVTPDKAGLWIAPRSHLLGVQPSITNADTAPGHRETTYQPENALALPTMLPGDACIFDRYTLHRSLQNQTDTHRYAYAAQYQAENTRPAATGKRDPLRMLATELHERWQAQALL